MSKALVGIVTFIIATACYNQPNWQQDCQPYCSAVVLDVIDANTLVLDNGKEVDLLNYYDIDTKLTHGRMQFICLESQLEGERISYMPIRRGYSGNERIDVKNKIIRCK